MRLHRTSVLLLAAGVSAIGVAFWMRGDDRVSPPDEPVVASRRERSSDLPRRVVSTAEIRAHLAAASPLPPGALRDEAIIRLLRELAATDPAEAVAFACEHPEVHGQAGLATELFAGWLEKDEAGALAFAGAFARGEARDGFVAAVASHLASQDPERALSLAGELPGYDGDISSLPPAGRWDESDEIAGSVREHAYAGIFREWAASDPAAAVVRACGLSDPLLRNLALQEIGGKWVLKNPEAAVAWATGFAESRDRDSAVEGIIGEWTRHAPRSAAAFIERSGAAPGRDAWLGILATNWTDERPREALDWAAGISSDKDRRHAIRAVLAGIGGQGLRKAADFAVTLPAGPARREGMELVLVRWAAEDAAAFNEWAAALPQEELRREVRGILSAK